MFLSIRNKILITHFSMVLAVGLAIGASGFYFIGNHVNFEETKHLEFISKMINYRILDVISKKKSILQRILRGKELDIYVEKYNDIVLIQYFVHFSKEFPVLSYVNTKGKVELKVVHGKTSTDNSDISDSSLFNKIMAEPDKIIMVNDQNNVDVGGSAVTFAMAKHSFFGDKVVGFLIGSVPVSGITGFLSEIEVGKTGFILLSGNKNNIIYLGTKHDIMGKSIEKANDSHDSIIKPVPSAKGISRAFVLGVDSIVAFVPIEEIMWSLMVVMPYTEYMSEARKLKYITISVLILVLLVSGVIFTLITNNITNNITNPLKKFVSFTKMVAKGDYSQITDIRSKDELGVLAGSFNNMLTELKKSRDDLNAAKEYTDNIIETITSAVIVLSKEAEILKINKSVQDMICRTEEELLKKHISFIFEGNTFSSVLYEELINKGCVKNVEATFKTEQGVMIPVIFSASVIHGSDGKIEAIVCSAQDITPLKRIQELSDMNLKELEMTNKYLKQSQAQLVQAEKMASLSQLVAGVAHEINTPVGIGITMSSSLVKTTENIMASFKAESLNQSQIEEYINDVGTGNSIILRNLLRTADLIKSFKMVSIDQITQEKQRFRIKEYLEEILVSLRPKLKIHSHNIKLIGTNDVEVNSYPGVFAQIITNLLMNSLIHAYDPGDEGNIIIEVIACENEIVLKYRDDGKGVPQENLKRIFDPFFTTRRGSGGTGLGLHIVFNIVTQNLDGSILCESTVGKGTAFTITFPATTRGRHSIN